jgi:hypothetical protein
MLGKMAFDTLDYEMAGKHFSKTADIERCSKQSTERTGLGVWNT